MRGIDTDFGSLGRMAVAGVFAALLAAPFSSLRGDDRDLLRESSGRPYVFILFDTSGSMNQRPGDTEPIAAADSPESKFYQAKEALYEVIDEFDDIQYGWGTFNQDDLRVRRKHWIYRPATAPSWASSLNYPAVGQGYVFGGPGTGTATTTLAGTSCGGPIALPPSTANFNRITGVPRTGDDGGGTGRLWLRQGGETYRLDTEIDSGNLGDASIMVSHRRRQVRSCSNGTFDSDTTVTIRYDLVTDALLWDQVTDINANDTCDGWEPNDDSPSGSNQDDYRVTSTSPDTFVNLKYPTTVDPSFSSNRRFDSGDVIPLSWVRDNRDELLRRIAPNIRLGESVPDFRIARYFEDAPTGTFGSGSYALELRDPNVRTLVASGSTPLGGQIQDFRTWYAGCAQGTCPKNTGWKDVAAVNDPDWACRKKFLIVLTDGDETCSGGNSACNGTAALRAQEGVSTFVVAFGVQGGSNVLTCMASNGGTGDPVFPQDKTALLQALREIFGKIREQSRAFASAAVPGVQAEVQDKIYLTNFVPLNGSSVWDGHVDAYLKPLPLTPAGLPDRTKNCAAGAVSGCRVWDAGERLVGQAPTAADLAVATPNFRLGGGADERRVFYAEKQTGPAVDDVPQPRRLLLPGTSLVEQQDLWDGLGIDGTVPATANATVLDVLKFTLRQKVETVTDPVTGATRDITYVLGDIFHSNPILLSSPNRFRYFAANLGTAGDTCADGDPGYRCYFEKHRLRRKMLVVGSNDGQLHFFDAGIFRGAADSGEFDNGTGREILSYVPRPVMPVLTQLAQDTRQEWGVDGTVQFDDVLIDPSHNGTPTEADREWRTVLIGGLREGGRGYFALDVTQPDEITGGLPRPIGTYIPSCWNGGPDCGPSPFGAVLWNLTDATDEDANGIPDMGETWSTPNTGRIRVIDPVDSTRTIDKYVAVFGGGMDPDNLNRSGNWLYMVDIETGRILYKRVLVGSAPSDPAAVDTDQDGYLDTIYIGTTAGLLYKASIANPVDIDGATQRILDATWEPFPIFDTFQPALNRRGPIFFAPSVIFVTSLGKYALAFGTGNRENLWATDAMPGRFYLILDTGFTAGDTSLPRREDSYFQLDVTSAANPGENFLLRPALGKSPGWFLRLEADERLITKAFALAGITIFTSYEPRTLVSGGGPGGGPGGTTPICARAGESNIYIVYTVNGDPLDANSTTDATLRSRFKRVPEFVTSPFVESSTTKNPCDPATDPNCNATPPVCRNQEAVTQTLKGQFPTNCKFANYTQNIETIQSDEGLVCIAPVPLCIVERNWKEF